MRKLLLALAIASSSYVAAAQSTQTPVTNPAHSALSSSDTARLGAYELEITTDDGTIVGGLTIGRNPEGLTAKVSVGEHTPAVKTFVRDGTAYVLTAGGDDFTVTYRLTFTDDAVAGSFKMSNGMSGVVAGKRKQ